MTNVIGDNTVEIRPGVFRPDWSAARSDAAKQALRERAEGREGLLDKWMHALEPDLDRVWRGMLEFYGGAGRPPSAQRRTV
jgi:hypothetical protein